MWYCYRVRTKSAKHFRHLSQEPIRVWVKTSQTSHDGETPLIDWYATWLLCPTNRLLSYQDQGRDRITVGNVWARARLETTLKHGTNGRKRGLHGWKLCQIKKSTLHCKNDQCQEETTKLWHRYYVQEICITKDVRSWVEQYLVRAWSEIALQRCPTKRATISMVSVAQRCYETIMTLRHSGEEWDII